MVSLSLHSIKRFLSSTQFGLFVFLVFPFNIGLVRWSFLFPQEHFVLPPRMPHSVIGCPLSARSSMVIACDGSLGDHGRKLKYWLYQKLYTI